MPRLFRAFLILAAILIVAFVAQSAFFWYLRAPREPLALAAHRGDVAEVRRLLAAGVNPNQRDASGSTPLMAAARGGHFPGPHRCGGQSAEHLATIRALLEGGADPDLTDRNGWTAKIVAEHHHQAESAARLARGR